MGIPFKSVGNGNIFNLARHRALKEAEAAFSGCDPFPEKISDLGPPRNFKAPTPWHIVPGFEGRSAVMDAEMNLLFVERSDLVHRLVEAINEVEGRIRA